MMRTHQGEGGGGY